MPGLPLAVWAEQAVMAQRLWQFSRAPLMIMQQFITAATGPQLRKTGTFGTNCAALGSCKN